MQEINIKNNPSGLKLFINGVPQIELIPKEKLDVVINTLEKQIDIHFADKTKHTQKK
jgi:hypothetical protein